MSGPNSVLVTGAAGFIGWHVVRAMQGAGWSVRAFVRSTSRIEHLRRQGVEIHVGDLDDPASLSGALRGVDAVVHLAGVMSAPSEEAFRRVNTDGTIGVLDAVERHAPGLRRFVFVSSLSAVGPVAVGDPPPGEDAVPRPWGAYGRTKLEAEAAVQERRQRLPVTLFRPPVVYGPRDRSLLPYFQTVRAGIILLPGRGQMPLSIIHAADLAAAVRLAVEKPHRSGTVFHIADGPARRFRDLAELVRVAQETPATPLSLSPGTFRAAIAAGRFLLRRGVRVPRWAHPDLVGFALGPAWTCSEARLRAELGWAPAVPLDEGLRQTVEWYREAGWLLRKWGVPLNRRGSRPSKVPPEPV